MCRHSLPHFNLPVARVLHSVGQVVASHPAPAVAAILVALCAAVFFALHRHPRWPAIGWRASGVGAAGRGLSPRRGAWAPRT